MVPGRGATAATRRGLPLLLASLLAACGGRPPAGLGLREGHLAACPDSPNCVSSQAGDEPHRIAPLAFAGDPEAAWERLRELLSTRPDATVVGAGPGYLRVEFRTRLGFVDDGEFALDREAAVIHVRSASRLGYSDLGKNRARLEEVRGAFAAGRPAAR